MSCILSMDVAEQMNRKHHSVICLVRRYLRELNEVGSATLEMRIFHTAGGPQRKRVAALDEAAANLLITYMRNNDPIRSSKKRIAVDAA